MPVVIAIAILGLAAGVTALLPPTYRRAAAAVTALAAVAAPLVLVVAAARSGVGFHLEADFGALVPNVNLVLRLTPSSFGVVVVATIALLISATETSRRPAERSALLLATLGAVVAACAGNAVLLGIGLDVVTAATFLAANAALGRRGRASLWAFAAGIFAATLLAVAAVQLQNSYGTSGFTTLPATAMTVATTMPWALAGVFCLCSPLLTPSAINPKIGMTWASVGAVPTGIAILLHLGEAAPIGLDPAVVSGLAVIGCVMAVATAAAAIRHSASAAVAGRFLCVSAAGPVIALAGLSNGGSRLAFGVACVALELWAITVAAWTAPGGRQRGPVVTALLLVMALGFAFDSGFLGVAAALHPGDLPGKVLATGLALAAVLTVAAGALAARRSLASPSASVGTARAAIPCAALLPVGVAALAPGAVAASVAAVLGVESGAADPLSVGLPGVTWPGGYGVAAGILAAAAAWSVTELLGRGPGGARRARSATDRPAWSALLRPRRRVAPVAMRTRGILNAADTWLLTQPQFGIATLAAFIALLFVR